MAQSECNGRIIIGGGGAVPPLMPGRKKSVVYRTGWWLGCFIPFFMGLGTLNDDLLMLLLMALDFTTADCMMEKDIPSRGVKMMHCS